MTKIHQTIMKKHTLIKKSGCIYPYDQLTDEMKFPDNWFARSSWAKITNQLTLWERKFSFDIGVQIGHRKPLSEKQVIELKKIFQKQQI